jgi:hypothetical protein
MSAHTPAQTIVIAWVEMTGTRFTGRYRDRYALEPICVAEPEAKAAIWLNEGSADDIAKARKHLATIGEEWADVYTFDPGHPEPQKKARAMILASVRA